MTQEKKKKTPNVLPMSKATKERIAKVAKEIGGKDWFPEKVAEAKKTFSKIKTLPI